MKKPLRFQLIFQFPEAFFESYEAVMEFEEKLICSMAKTCEVDGHDVGSGTTNFFVYTDTRLLLIVSFASIWVRTK